MLKSRTSLTCFRACFLLGRAKDLSAPRVYLKSYYSGKNQEETKWRSTYLWREFPSAPCLAGKNFMTARVSMLLKSRASLTCFRACFLPGRAKDLSAPRVYLKSYYSERIKKRQNGEARIFHNGAKKRTKSKQGHTCVENIQIAVEHNYGGLD